ncbi:hypothetical protein POPTR_017G080801v4 [Populus trichocarpa]|uniref:Uncharacterized protein n=1 Tax=Populus trichocarpa TaxID=3694 RepID=A0ACC0RQI9_POPTR|nr:hypothetical protein POPTR_017G080801v4 [Populus trichocarpa]
MLFPEVSLWRGGGMPIPMGLLYYSYSANASTRGIIPHTISQNSNFLKPVGLDSYFSAGNHKCHIIMTFSRNIFSVLFLTRWRIPHLLICILFFTPILYGYFNSFLIFFVLSTNTFLFLSNNKR